jgi:hypothetical protein
MKEVMVIEFASDVSINDLNCIVDNIRLNHGYAIADIYPVKVVK